MAGTVASARCLVSAGGSVRRFRQRVTLFTASSRKGVCLPPEQRMRTRVFAVLFLLSAACTAAAQSNRQIAITVDDLPASSAYQMDAATLTEINSQIVGTFRDQKIPAIGFVNEDKLYRT